MKKIMLLFLILLPLNINAEEKPKLELMCEPDEYTIGTTINCNLNIENNNFDIKEISFKTGNSINNVLVNPEYTLINTGTKYQILFTNNVNKNSVLSFDTEINDYSYQVILTDFEIKLNDYSTITDIDDLVKSFEIKKESFLENILINQHKIQEFNSLKYDYEIDVNDKYLEIEAIAYANYKVLDSFEHKLIDITNIDKITIKVEDIDQKIKEYTIKLNHVSEEKLLKVVNITEINFLFNPHKYQYYFQVPYAINGLSFNFEAYNNDAIYEITNPRLLVGNNVITLVEKTSKKTYTFYVERLAKNVDVNNSVSLKSLKIGNNIIDLREDVYSYNIDYNENRFVQLTTANENQDYDISYDKKNITINVYGASGKKATYLINMIDPEALPEPETYDNTNNIIIACVFGALVALTGVLLFIKEREYKKNF